ncbi:MAG: NAD-dependent epimerase/dehydratase family protein [Planctomycetota bacterium]
MKKNIVVTGAAGFLGSYFIKMLNTKKYNVYAIDRKRFTFKGIIPIVTDIKNINNFQDKLPEKIDYLYHFAAIKDISVCEKNYEKTYFNNTYLTLKLLFELKHRIKTFIFTSSCAVYGENKVPTKEEYQPLPLSFYALSKLAAENYCLLFSRLWKINTIVLRLFNLYGKWYKKDVYQGVIIKFINRIEKGKAITIYGDGKQFRDFISVSDVCKILLIFLKKLPQQIILNIGTGKKIEIIKLCSLLQKVLNKKVERYHTKPRQFEIYHSLADNKKLLKFLDNNFSFCSFESGISDLLIK